MMLRSICVMAAATGLAMSAQATVITVGTLTMYTTQAEFTAALTTFGETAGVDNFDTLGSSLSASLTRSAGNYSYTVSSIFEVSGNPSSLARTGTGPDYALTTVPVTATKHQTQPGNILDFADFFPGVNAAAVTVGELGSSSTNLYVSGSDGRGDLVHTVTLAPGTTFVGFTSTQAMTDLEVYVAGWPAGIEPVVTNLYLAAPSATAAVPEPATWAMMIGGFGSVGAVMRRRKTISRAT